MKLMVFNTQHCLNYRTRNIDFEVMAETIRRFEPDVVGLNEMRGAGASEDYTDQVGTLQALTGYPYAYFAKAFDVNGVDPYGNAILSKIPLTDAQTILIPKGRGQRAEPRCLLKATLAGGVTVLITHFGLEDDEKESAVRAILASLGADKTILMGDFNSRPDSAVLLPLRARLRDTADVFPEPLLSFPSDAPYAKIDYIFVSRDIEVLSADIPAVVSSDHRPYICEIKLPSEA